MIGGRSRVGGALAAVLLASGCSAVDPARVAAKQEVAALRDGWGERLQGHRLLIVAPVEPLPYALTAGEETLRAPARLDPAALAADLQQAFAAVVAPAATGGPPTVALAEHPDTAAAQAWAEGYDLLVQVTPLRWESTYLGRNGWWWPNALFLGWYFWPVGPQWWLADEVYGVDLELAVRVVDVASGRPLVDDTVVTVRSPREAPDQAPTAVDVVHAPRLALDDLDRGLDLFGTWIAGLEPDQWEQVSGHLAPYARRAAAVRVAAHVAAGVTEFDGKPQAERARRLATVHALALGVSAYEERECVAADGDAERFHALLTGAGGAGARWAPDKNLLLLKNAQVGERQLEAALERLQERARPSDTLVVYFAGRGVRRRAAGLAGFALQVPPDERGPRSGLITLAELAGWLDAVPARRRLVVIDADFLDGPRGSPAASALDPVAEEALRRALREGFLSGGASGAVVLASRLRGDERAQVYAGQGLLTRYLVEGLRGAADAGGDGLTPRDLAVYLERHVGNLSEVALDDPQHPLVVSGTPTEPLR